MLRHSLRLAACATGLALMAPVTGYADDLGYSFRSLATLDGIIAGEPVYDNFAVEAANAAGAVLFTTQSDNGEGAFLIEPDGKQTRLFKRGEATPMGGAFGLDDLNSRVDLNDAGNLLLSVTAD